MASLAKNMEWKCNNPVNKESEKSLEFKELKVHSWECCKSQDQDAQSLTFNVRWI